MQQLLAERRELMVANERLRLELAELRGDDRREDPRLGVLELQNRALRDEVAALRGQLDVLEQAVDDVVEQIEREKAPR